MNHLQLRNRLKSLRHLAKEDKSIAFLELSIKTRKQLKKEPTDTNVRILKYLEVAENTTDGSNRVYQMDRAIEELK